MTYWGTGRLERGLGGARGFGETMLPPSDDETLAIDVSSVLTGGLRILSETHLRPVMYVNTNGTISFGSGFAAYPTPDNLAPPLTVIAPFWADVDTRLDGEAPESGGIWVDLDTTAGVVTITWDSVGMYRRDATITNSFQLQILNKGAGDADLIFRYENITWTQGTAPNDSGARAGLFGPQVSLGFQGPTDTLETRSGSSDIQGLWGITLRNGVAGLKPADPNEILGTTDSDILRGSGRPDRIEGRAGNDTIYGMDGADTLLGEEGDDILLAGATAADLRDVVFAGNGNDSVDGGYGNDDLRGDAGNDTLEGGFGADRLFGGDGNDHLSGGALGDELFGGPGADFLNGGFGFDRLNGGGGNDHFYHLGVRDHGTDWIQDFTAAHGDRLVWGAGRAVAQDFLVQSALTPGAGQGWVAELFVTHRPTGLLVWALVDGAAQNELVVLSQGRGFDLLE